jgi:hypothetical protein
MSFRLLIMALMAASLMFSTQSYAQTNQPGGTKYGKGIRGSKHGATTKTKWCDNPDPLFGLNVNVGKKKPCAY